MIRYQIRSIPLLDLVNDVRSGRLIPDAYFQRNLVWRDVHKRDFIETILKGFPFPQMFFSRGKIDVESMQTTKCIVDGQQRTNAIIEFVDNKFELNGGSFKTLTEQEKTSFLKYEIAIVELDLENDDPLIKEVFARVNRTSNSLTTIEKLTSEYASTEYMFTARLLSGDIEFPGASDEEADWRVDPNTPQELYIWAKKWGSSNVFSEEFVRIGVFREREISRMVHVMYVLNIISTIISGFFNRNEKTMDLLNDYSQAFPRKDWIVEVFTEVGDSLKELNLEKGNFWTAKANFFSLSVALANALIEGKILNITKTKHALENFSNNVPEDYALAAREGVNNKREREIRNTKVSALLHFT
jgi:hypothetical protein